MKAEAKSITRFYLAIGTACFVLACSKTGKGKVYFEGELKRLESLSLDSASMSPSPFEKEVSDGRFTVAVWIERPEIFEKYYSLFKRNGYEGNGPCWVGHITQILETLDPSVLHQVVFDDEAGSFHAYFLSESSRNRFVEVLNPIFIDLRKLNIFVENATRWRIDD